MSHSKIYIVKWINIEYKLISTDCNSSMEKKIKGNI